METQGFTIACCGFAIALVLLHRSPTVRDGSRVQIAQVGGCQRCLISVDHLCLKGKRRLDRTNRGFQVPVTTQCLAAS